MSEQEIEEPTDDQESATPSRLSESTDDDLPSSGLLSFYDRLRDRMLGYVETKGGRLTPQVAEFFLLVPDIFVLLFRLARDNEVPKESRALIGGALAYFVLPFDIFPEAVVGPAGYADDLILAMTVLAHAFGRELEPFAEKYWSGSKTLRQTLRDVLIAGKGLLSTDLNERLRSLLASKGIDLDAVEAEADDEDDEGDTVDA